MTTERFCAEREGMCIRLLKRGVMGADGLEQVAFQ